MYEPPIKITIPIPSYIPYGHGLKATSGHGGNLRVRCTNDERGLIETEAKLLGLTVSGFVRWVSLYAAKALEKHRVTNNESIETEVSKDERRVHRKET